MAKVLYIKGSPMEERSYSNKVADEFLSAYKESHPDDIIDTMDLWKEKLPEFDITAASGKYKIMGGKEHSEEEKKAWEGIIEVINRFKSADKIVLSAPMWNFGTSYKVKHFIDIIVQPGFTFSFDPATGYTGLVTGKPALLVLARGGEYPEGTPFATFDHQHTYLKVVFSFMGFTDITTMLVEPTLMKGPDAAKEKTMELIKEAKEKAKTF